MMRVFDPNPPQPHSPAPASESALWRHNLSPEVFDDLLAQQFDVCAICRHPTKKLVIDHDHECCPNLKGYTRTCGACVRGLLCHRCNMLVGYLEKTPPDVLVRAIRYVDGHNPRRVARGVDNALAGALLEYLDYVERAA